MLQNHGIIAKRVNIGTHAVLSGEHGIIHGITKILNTLIVILQ